MSRKSPACSDHRHRRLSRRRRSCWVRSGSAGAELSLGPAGFSVSRSESTADGDPNGAALPPLPEAQPDHAPGVHGSTQGAGTRDDEDGRHFPCTSCGSDLVYTIGELALHCGHCGFSREIELAPDQAIDENDYAAALAQIEAQRERRGAEATSAEVLSETVACEACGAEVTFDGSITSLECGYCGTPLQRDHVHLDPDRIPVDAVLPFSVDQKAARKSLRSWVKGLWFAPNKFKKTGVSGDLKGVYLPFWTFDSLTFTQFSGQRGDYYYQGSGKNRRRRTRWRRVRDKFQHFFDDVLVLAAREVRSTPLGPTLHRLEPWPLGECRTFQPEFLAGFQARTYDTQLEDGFSEAHERMKAVLESQVRRRIGGDTQRINELRSRFDAVTYKHVLLPLWLLTYRHGTDEKQVVINAMTGKVYGERPWSVIKILFAILAAAIAIGFVLLLSR